MKKSVTALAAIAFVGALCTTAIAGPVGRFDNGYLDQHPEVAQQLGHDPRLVDNPRFLANHPGLDEYFRNHPEVRSDLQNHPDRFMAREALLRSPRGMERWASASDDRSLHGLASRGSGAAQPESGAGGQSQVRRESPGPGRVL
jgi:hypothetical protein